MDSGSGFSHREAAFCVVVKKITFVRRSESLKCL